ncbi:MAG: type II secretion system protein [Verrucomicrobia bacterium]|nr:MAG: type II secretion system protein [Verrucomicrobiota bacterium]
MNRPSSARQSGFTLLETVIAIGVLAVLLTAFMYAFGPAMSGIRRSINIQEADRLASTLQSELTTLRSGQQSGDIQTGFDKSFQWIKQANDPAAALFVYQYRGDPSKHRADSTLEPSLKIGGVAGKDYVVLPMVRRLNDPLFLKDLDALQGVVFYIKCTQLIYNKDKGLIPGTAGTISDPLDGSPAGKANDYKEAVIAFSAEFYSMPANNQAYFTGPNFKKSFKLTQKPIFTRNLAVRR